MKIVNICGGLGNQMFQYAFALYLKNINNDEIIKIDPEGLNHYNLHNGYELDRIFNISLPVASKGDKIKLYYPFFNYFTFKICKYFLPKRKAILEDKKINLKKLQNKKSNYFIGYWQKANIPPAIRNIILKEFSFPKFPFNSKNYFLKEKIKNLESVSIHVRRGDYCNNKSTQGICSIEYYKKAIQDITDKYNVDIFLIFSDDIEWCKIHILPLIEDSLFVFVDWNKKQDSYNDMHLMSLCKHNIIANSSFSWWGAWLNQNTNKIVIAPERWMNNDNDVSIIPNDWIKIKG